MYLQTQLCGTSLLALQYAVQTWGLKKYIYVVRAPLKEGPAGAPNFKSWLTWFSMT